MGRRWTNFFFSLKKKGKKKERKEKTNLSSHVAPPKPDFRVGGARGSKTRTACANPQTCLASRLSMHLTPSSSAYIENTWSWTADHDLDGGSGTVYPGTAGGFLIEAQHGTWILGSGVGEFYWLLFSYNFRLLLPVSLENHEGGFISRNFHSHKDTET